jgi:lysophospholipase L1-like esterase
MNYDSRRGPAARTQLALRLVLVAALLAAAAVAVLALWAARHLNHERAELRLVPVHAGEYAADNEKTGPPQGRRVVFFGDSRIQGWRPQPEVPGAELLWRGIGGETTAQMRYRFDEDVLALHPSTVVIQAGINDLVAGAIVGRKDETIRNTIDNLGHFVDAARSASVEVVLLTVLRPARSPPWRAPFWPKGVTGAVARVNEAIRAMAGEGVQVIDADAWLAGQQRALPRRYALDTLHLNEAGYAHLNEIVEGALGTGTNAVQ